jgi:AbrB family looped-hinge helix DNA binding protein
MELVTVKNKYQVVIPLAVRKEAGVRIGDLLEATVDRGRILLTPKAVIDRGVAESLADFKAGRFFGPFESHADLIASLHKEARKAAAHKRSGKTRRR